MSNKLRNRRKTRIKVFTSSEKIFSALRVFKMFEVLYLFGTIIHSLMLVSLWNIRCPLFGNIFSFWKCLSLGFFESAFLWIYLLFCVWLKKMVALCLNVFSVLWKYLLCKVWKYLEKCSIFSRKYMLFYVWKYFLLSENKYCWAFDWNHILFNIRGNLFLYVC